MNPINFNHLNHLPHVESNHASLQHAVKFKVCQESLLSVPKSAIIDGIISYGGSTGVGLNLARKAYGEFFERNHLFTQVPIHLKKALKDIQPENYHQKLLGICRQDESSKEECLNHEFLFTNVHNLFDDAPQEYFYNAITLSPSKQDQKFIGFSDSCACAAHPNKDAAIYNSLMEFIERQALLGSWLSKTYRYTINPDVLPLVTPYQDMAEQLLEHGELVIVENNNQLPGYSVIIFYFAKSPKDSVQYSIGSSSGLSLEEALNSALVELYQCYAFLYNTESSKGLENKAGAGYHLSFQQCNHAKIRQTIPFLQNLQPFSKNHSTEIFSTKKYAQQEILDELKELSKDIFYYHHFEPSLGLHMTKLLSPDFFSHMGLNQFLNIDNAYAKKLGITKENAFMGKIPFP